MRYCAVAVVFAALAALPAQGQSFTVVTEPNSAKIFGLDDKGNRVQLGVGTAKVKLEKNAPNRYWVSADGYATLDTVFVRDIKYPKSVTLSLSSRVVRVTALPYDAEIRVNGKLAGREAIDVIIPAGIPVTLEVAKTGYKTERKVYRNEPGAELPLAERFELRDRAVKLQPALPRSTEVASVQPTVSVDGQTVGTGNVDVIVPFDKCVTATVSLPGYKPEPRTLCNMQGRQPPEITMQVPLVDKLVALTTLPGTAEIVVDNKVVGTGNFNLIVRNNSCVKVFVRAVGYSRQVRQFCNQDNVTLEPEARIELPTDESYVASVESDQANVNFTIEVAPGRTPDQAWQTISQVVMGMFDVLEITDKETGYMRTAWEVSKFNSGEIVRTRVIVKSGGTTPLKYVIKVASERAERPDDGEREVSVRDDEKFAEWPRLMKQYKDVINEMQARLR